jgi:hypothetical protein
MQDAQKPRSKAHLQLRCNDEVAAQRRRWNFCETIDLYETGKEGQTSETPERAKGVGSGGWKTGLGLSEVFEISSF